MAQDFGFFPPEKDVKAHERQAGNPRQPAQLHQGKVTPDQPDGLLQWSDGISEQREEKCCHLPGLVQGL